MCTHVFRWVCRGASLEDGVCKVGKVYEVGPIVGQRFHDGPVSRKREAHDVKSREKKQFCTIGIGIGITLDVV